MSDRVPSTLAAAVHEEVQATGKAPCAFGIAMSRVPAKRWSTRSDLFDCLAKARARLDADPREPIQLGELAALVGVSPFHFQRLFKEFFGRSPLDYHRQIRLELAKRLIEEGTRVIEACTEVGFQSPSSFTRLFRRAFGVSPGKVKGSRGQAAD